MKICILLIILLFIIIPTSTLSQHALIDELIQGRNALKSKDYLNAEQCLTKILPEFKEIGDYILFWRAKARMGMNKYEEALKDIEILKKNYPHSPLLKKSRKEEIEIAKKLDLANIERIYESFINDYPDETEIKFEYALYLKDLGKTERAKKLLKEIFVTATLLADRAEKELSENDITVNDLIKKAKALNNAYLFKKAEKYLRDAISKANPSQLLEVLSTLGYSLFMQKKYSESAEIFKKCSEHYWRARALVRAGDFETFEKELPEYIRLKDSRISDVLINYANIKRRAGETDEAVKILKMVNSQYPSSKEESLWYLGWIHYITGELDKAKQIFQELYLLHGKLKYFYWLEKVNELKGVMKTKEYSVSFRPGDIYSYLLYMKGKVSFIPESVSISPKSIIPKRIDTLLRAGFREEALQEIKIKLNDSGEIENIPLMSKLLYELGDYPTSVRLISKIPNSFSYQDLLYPQVYRDTVLKASNQFNIDPCLIFAIMREESRFDRQAQSPAGAIGVMQLMLNTAKKEGKKIGISVDSNTELFDSDKNILIGSFHLKNLIEKFGSTVFAIAAYNAGEKAVSSWIKSTTYRDIDEFIEDIPYSETKAYVKRVLTSYFEYLRINKALTDETISKIIKVKGGRS